MSGTQFQHPSAREIDAAAADWLQRRHFWDWSEDDQAAFDAWISQSLAHRAAYLRLSDIWNRTGRLVALRPQARASRPLHKIVAHLAAGFAILAVVAGGAMWLKPQTPQHTYSTSIGGRETIMLVDGSQIELNTDTVLRVAKTGRERTVWLDKGEAYFQIRHDADKPFVVWVEGHRVVDLGTKFVVRREPGKFEVSLVEGKARLDGPGNRQAVLLPGDVAVATEESLQVSKRPERVMANDLGWRRGVLTFNKTTLADAVAEFNRYNHTKIVIDDPKVARLTIYGAFAANDVAAFADAAQAYFKLHIENRDGQIVLSH